MKVILIGYRATGKSTVGMLLSKKIRIPFVDTDRLIEKTAGRPVREVILYEGWERFRERETQAIMSLSLMDSCVVATGGGAILAPVNRELLKKSGILIYLKTPLEDIVGRLERDAQKEQTRPQFTSGGLLEETKAILAERIPIYESVADYAVDTNDKSVVRVRDDIYQHLLETGIVSEMNRVRKKLKRRF